MRPLAGLLVDGWTEVVPSRSETTGIAFQYDWPDSAAPQAILLETLDLARLRLVQPGALGAVARCTGGLNDSLRDWW
jgi:hypothetical protein